MEFYCMPGPRYAKHYLTRATYLDRVKATAMKEFFHRFNSSQYVHPRGKVTFLLSRPLDYLAAHPMLQDMTLQD